jgi:hypothetical protein
MAITRSGYVNAGFGGDPRTVTFASLDSGSFTSLAAGETLIVVASNSSAANWTSATCGGNAMTADLGNTSTEGGRTIWRYYSASGGETSCEFNTGASVVGWFNLIVDDAIDNTDPVDTSVAWAASGEGFAVPHQFDITTGVPAAGGLVVCAISRDDATGTSGSTVVGVASGADLVYKAGIATGAVAINFDLGTAGNCDGMVISYNYAGGGGGGPATYNLSSDIYL